jgi:PIN domain nuclease of toxin-antitoxin system
VRLLLYSHPLIWYVDQDYLLSTKAHAEITDPNNDLWISAATVWEISIKVWTRQVDAFLALPPMD